MKLALVERELRRQAVRKLPYGLRTSAALISGVLLGFLFMFSSSVHTDAEGMARTLYGIAVAVQSFAATFVPLLVTPELIAREKQQRTLELLLLAEPRAYAIYFSKLLLAFLYCEWIILGVLPVLALVAMLGGIEIPVLVGRTLLFSMAALTYCCLGMFFSTISERPGQAFLATFLVMGVWAGGAMEFLRRFVLLPATGPFYSEWSMTAFVLEPTQLAFMYSGIEDLLSPGLGLAIASVILLIPITIWLLPRRMSKQSTQGQPTALPAQRRPGKASKRLRNPAGHLLTQGSGGLLTALRPWPLRLIAAGLLLFLTPFYLFGALFLLALISYDVASTVQRIREGGILDDVRLAVADRHTLIITVYGTVLGRCWLYVPALSALGVFGFMPVYLPLVSPGPRQGMVPNSIQVAVLIGPWILLGYFQLRLVVAVALEKALGDGSSGRKAARSVRHLIGVCTSACLAWIVFIFIGAVLVIIVVAPFAPVSAGKWEDLIAQWGVLCAGCLAFYFSSETALTLLPGAYTNVETQ